MQHPLIRDFGNKIAFQALRAWVGRRFPKIVDDEGFEDQFVSAATHILRTQNRLVDALEFQLIDQLVRLSPEQQRAQAKDLYKSGNITDKRGARNAALRVVSAKPPPTKWRRKLQRLRSNPNLFSQFIADRDIRAVLRWGALRAGILDKCGPRWLHHLRDNPDELQLAIKTALNDPMLRGDIGRHEEHHFVKFVADVMVVCRDFTDHTLSHKIRLKDDTCADVSSNDIGIVVSPDILLLQDLLAPFGDERSADGVSHLIRKARKTIKSHNSAAT